MDNDNRISILEERLKRLEEIANLGTWEMEVDTGKSRWSDQFYRICGYEPGSIEPTAEVGMTLIHPDDRERAAEAVKLALQNKPYRIEKRIIRPDGSIRYVQSCGRVEFDKEGNPVRLLGTFLDITERKEAELKAKELSIRDGLTGIFNRNYSIEQIDLEIKRCQRYGGIFSVLMMDLDHFKIINDTFGHQSGDKVLCHFTKITSEIIRKNDCFGRYGGEEFLVIIPECNIDSAVAVAEKIRVKFSEERFPEEYNSIEKLTVSIGVAEYNGNEKTDDLILRADKALYKAKNNGRNCVKKS